MARAPIIATVLLLGFIGTCLFALKYGIALTSQPGLDLPDSTPYTAQGHYSVHASISDEGLRLEPFCGDYQPTKAPAKTGRQTHSEEARDMQIVEEINSITDQPCDGGN